MAIQNMASLSTILETHNSNDWMKSADIKLLKSPELDSSPDLRIADHESQKSFSELLADSITGVNGLQKEADMAIQKLTSGKTKNIHETLMAVERADIAFRTMNQIRMKVIDAYKDIMRMQI